MKINKKFLFTSIAALFLVPTATINSKQVEAKSQTITIKSAPDYAAANYYTRKNGKFSQDYNSKVSANKTFKVKSSIYDDSEKIPYTGYGDEVIIGNTSFYYLGDGGYIKTSNTQGIGEKSVKVSRNSYIYDKNGKRLKSFRNKKAYFPAGTTIKLTVKSKYYKTPYTYYNVGNGKYIKNSDVSKLDGKGVMFISHNAYIYNNKGKRANKVTLKTGTLINYYGSVKDGKSQYYYYANVGETKLRHIPNYKIGKKWFFKIAKNKYIKANNINTINGKALFTKGPIEVTVTRDTYYLNDKFQATNKLVKAGKTLKVDQAIRQGVSDYTMVYYHVAGTKDYLDSDLATEYPNSTTGPYDWSGGSVLSKQYLEDVSYNDLHYSLISFKKGVDPVYYNFNGDKTTLKVDDGDDLAANEAVYIYNSKTKQTDLYYHLEKSIFIQWGAEDTGIDTAINDVYVKASDVDIRGLKLKPINTASSAEKSANTVASESQLTKLKDSIADENSIKKSDKYRLETWANRTTYDNAIKNAQDVLNKKTPTMALVEQAQWQVDFAKKNLKGAKIKVKDINHITPQEGQQIFSLMAQSYSDGPGYYPMVGLYHKYAHKNGYYPTSAWDNNEKSVFFLYKYSGAKREKIDIADFATEK
ncbi:SLAP domain-containing protein [Lactobacillus sp. LL6]|uniref:SLAP domain-containing protein n=1 Tax=Lactobacillus sp. LL6 TaxID=2596827 RepID=UPI00118665BE|nr:SLAP domain-containing protein [Lactobacillus sp. LL6]TSO25417.1 S-layer protein [Lactobacillus sp. LL6]